LIQASVVPPEYIRHIYPKVEGFLDRLVPTTNGRFEKIDLLHDMLTGRENLWVVVEEEDNEENIIGIVITEVMHYPRKRMLAIQYCSGDRLDEWMDNTLEILENWALDNDCEGMELTGRKGWVKKLKLQQWKEEFVVVKKDKLERTKLSLVKSEKKDGKEKRKQPASKGDSKRHNRNLSEQTA
tara:strand:+ start:871 stop:1419 length:549 start_codon:yes stop_codon:yes gene_type:complete